MIILSMIDLITVYLALQNQIEQGDDKKGITISTIAMNQIRGTEHKGNWNRN